MKIKKQVTRRGLALRWLTFLTFVIVWSVVLGRFRVLPSQAIREAERLGNLGRTRLITELPGHEGRTLRGNRNGLMLSLLNNFRAQGWEAENRTYLDCSKEAPFYAGVGRYSISQDGSWVGMADWFGRIDDPLAASVRLEIYENNILTGTYTVEKEEWIQKDGFTYFTLEFEKDGWSQYVRFQSTLLDERGKVLSQRKIEWDLSSRRFCYESEHQ